MPRLLLYHEVIPVDEILHRVEAVTLEEVQAVAAELAAAPRSLSVVGPFDAGDFDVEELALG